MHYLPLQMCANNALDSLKSPFYYSYDGRNVAVCFCTEKEFAQEQIEISRSQHFTDEYMSKDDGHWGLGLLEFGSIEQIMFFVKKWDVLVPVKTGQTKPNALALWKEGEPHRFISFADIEKHSQGNTDEENS